MSFGFSPSDIVTLLKLATKTYRGWKNACGEYADITSSLDGLCVLLGRIRDEANRPGSILLRKDKDREDLEDVLRGCRTTVEELNRVVVKYKSLSYGRKKNWDRLRLGVKNLGELRAKLTQYTSSITAYLEAVGLGSLARIEDQLNSIPANIQQNIDALAAEIRAGRREASIMTTYEDDEKDVWRQFRRELITSDGIRSKDIHRYKPLIRQYLRRLAEEGRLEEEAVLEEESGVDEEGTLEEEAAPGEALLSPSDSSTKEEFFSAEHEAEDGTNPKSCNSLHSGPSRDCHYPNNPFVPSLGPREDQSSSNSDSDSSKSNVAVKGLQRPCRRLYPRPSYPLKTVDDYLDKAARFCTYERTYEQYWNAAEYRHMTLDSLDSWDSGDFHFTIVPNPGAMGYSLEWTLPLRPAVADHHMLPSLHRLRSHRLFSIHPGRSDDILKFLKHRTSHGRKAFLQRQVQYIRPPVLKECTHLRIVLPPGWSYDLDHNDKLTFACSDSGRHTREARLPQLLEALPPPPKGWQLDQRSRDSVMWIHKASKVALRYHPAAHPRIRIDSLERHDLFASIDNAPDGRPWLLSPRLVRPDGSFGFLAPSVMPRERPTIALIEMFPELAGLNPVHRVSLELHRTEAFEQVNPGMWEHLVEWQEMTIGRADQHPSTRHLVYVLNNLCPRGKENYSDRCRTHLGKDEYRRFLGPVRDPTGISEQFNPEDTSSVDLLTGHRIALDDEIYTLRARRVEPEELEAEDERTASQAFQNMVANVLGKLEKTVFDQVPPHLRCHQQGLGRSQRARRMAFLCFFSSDFHRCLFSAGPIVSVYRQPGPADEPLTTFCDTRIWDAVSTYVRAFCGRVYYHSGSEHRQDGFVVFLQGIAGSGAVEYQISCALSDRSETEAFAWMLRVS